MLPDLDPVLFEPLESRYVDRDTEVLHVRDGADVSPTIERLNQTTQRCTGCLTLGADVCQQPFQQRCKGFHVRFAVVQQFTLFLFGEWCTTDRDVLLLCFLGDGVPVDVADPEILERRDQAGGLTAGLTIRLGESFRQCHVGEVAELDAGVEHPCRWRR